MLHTFPTYYHSINSCKEVNALIPTILGGGIARSVTRIIIGRYKAFQRCFRASLEGFAMSIGSMTMVVKAIQRIGLMTMSSRLTYMEIRR